MFWPLQSSFEFSGVPKDSKLPFSGVWVATSHFPQSGVVTVWALLVLRRITGKLRLTKLTTARTWGKPPPSPLYYTLCLSTRPTSKWHFVPGLPNGSPEIPKIRTPATLGPIILCADLRLKWGQKQSCNPHQELSNSMSHVTYTQGIWVDSRLLVVKSLIVNLTPGLSFGHNL